MTDYKSLFISLQHARNMCNARVQQYSVLLDSYTGRMNKLVLTQAKQRAESKTTDLWAKQNQYFKDQVKKCKATIKEVQEYITTYKSIIADASQAADFLQDVITMIETRTYDNFDFDKIIESIKYAIGLNELKVKLYRKAKSNCVEIIANQQKLADAQSNDVSVLDTKTFQNLAKRNDKIRIKHVQNIENLNIAMNIVMQYRKLKENRDKILNTERDTAIIIR